jgi:hypothetical protein
VARYKARLVAQSLWQRPGIDYDDETYSHVMHAWDHVPYLIAMKASLNMHANAVVDGCCDRILVWVT